ncbi:hypothetical protein HNQ08_002883 [Deinococcus humi]|uniref:Uncharacterized protein n=1 Tax=Deinococcus humi TaxID=662880 RepID=A0A7W8JXX6_9DEIO|nr:hypothetical protein [Deinococcus humi]
MHGDLRPLWAPTTGYRGEFQWHIAELSMDIGEL